MSNDIRPLENINQVEVGNKINVRFNFIEFRTLYESARLFGLLTSLVYSLH